jgi:uncharacterized protein YecT (DUF1311 family)
LIGEICPVNFLEDVRDIDSDTFAEIIVNEDDRNSGQPHVAGLREKVIYKLINNRLSEVSREKLPILNTQAEMNEFSARDFKEIEIKMNQIFEKIISSLEERIELKQSMEKAQEAWLKYREVQANANSKTYEGGSIYPLVYYTNMSKLTISRINELNKIVHRQEGSFA